MIDQSSARDVLLFWFGGPADHGKRHKRWFKKDPALDREIRERFLPLYEEAAAGRLAGWQESAHGCLALILVLDQFPRHIFRGSARAFAADGLALQAARHAVSRQFDRRMLAVERLFLYLPFEHSEALADQLTACELTEPLTAFEETADAHRYAIAHRDIVQRFGRFPIATRPSDVQARPRKSSSSSSPGPRSS